MASNARPGSKPTDESALRCIPSWLYPISFCDISNFDALHPIQIQFKVDNIWILRVESNRVERNEMDEYGG